MSVISGIRVSKRHNACAHAFLIRGPEMDSACAQQPPTAELVAHERIKKKQEYLASETAEQREVRLYTYRARRGQRQVSETAEQREARTPLYAIGDQTREARLASQRTAIYAAENSAGECRGQRGSVIDIYIRLYIYIYILYYWKRRT